METNIELPDGKVITLSHEGELTDEGIKKVVEQLGYEAPMTKESVIRNVLGEGTRIGGAIAGAVKGSKGGPAGAVIGGLVGAGAAEPIARWITPRDETMGESIANIALAGVQPEAKAASLLGRFGRGALVGGGLGMGHTATRTAIDEQRLPSLAELAPAAAGGAAFGGGLEALIGPRLAGKAAQKAAPPTPPVAPVAPATPITASLDRRKPSTLEGSNAQANEIITGKPADVVPPVVEAPAEPAEVAPVAEKPKRAAKKPVAPTGAFVLPKELAGAKPNYGYKTNQFGLNFESDLDKALYIIAQKNPSRRDADYLKLVMNHTGMTEPEARKAGLAIRENIKQMAKVSSEDAIDVPSMWTPKKAAAPAANANWMAEIQAQNVANWKGMFGEEIFAEVEQLASERKTAQDIANVLKPKLAAGLKKYNTANSGEVPARPIDVVRDIRNHLGIPSLMAGEEETAFNAWLAKRSPKQSAPVVEKPVVKAPVVAPEVVADASGEVVQSKKDYLDELLATKEITKEEHAKQIAGLSAPKNEVVAEAQKAEALSPIDQLLAANPEIEKPRALDPKIPTKQKQVDNLLAADHSGMVFHGTDESNLPSIISNGLNRDTNLSKKLGEQQGGFKVVLGYAKDKLKTIGKGYQDDLMISSKTDAKPDAIFINEDEFGHIPGSPSADQLDKKLSGLSESETNHLANLSSMIAEDGSVDAASRREYSAALKAAKKENPGLEWADLAREMVTADMHGKPDITVNEQVQKQMESLPKDLPVWAFSQDEEGRVTTRLLREGKKADAPVKASAEEMTIENASKQIAETAAQQKAGFEKMMAHKDSAELLRLTKENKLLQEQARSMELAPDDYSAATRGAATRRSNKASKAWGEAMDKAGLNVKERFGAYGHLDSFPNAGDIPVKTPKVEVPVVKAPIVEAKPTGLTQEHYDDAMQLVDETVNNAEGKATVTRLAKKLFKQGMLDQADLDELATLSRDRDMTEDDMGSVIIGTLNSKANKLEKPKPVVKPAKPAKKAPLSALEPKVEPKLPAPVEKPVKAKESAPAKPAKPADSPALAAAKQELAAREAKLKDVVRASISNPKAPALEVRSHLPATSSEFTWHGAIKEHELAVKELKAKVKALKSEQEPLAMASGFEAGSSASSNDNYSVPASGQAKHLLENIPWTPKEQKLVDAIHSIVQDVWFRVSHDVPEMTDAGINPAAIYNGSDGLVLFASRLGDKPGFTRKAILHELVHAATLKKIREQIIAYDNHSNSRYYAAHGPARAIDELRRHVADQMATLVKEGKVPPGDVSRFRYMLSNAEEFSAYAMMDDGFQKFLSTIKTNDDFTSGMNNRSVLKQLWEHIADVLGLSRKDVTALEDAMKHTEDLLGEPMDHPLSISAKDKYKAGNAGMDFTAKPALSDLAPKQGGSISGALGIEAEEEAPTAVRGMARRILDSESIPAETRAALQADPSINYETHAHGLWAKKAGAATDAELKGMIDGAKSADESIIYQSELSNRLIAAGKHDEAAKAFASAASHATPGGQALAAARAVRTVIGDLHEVEEVVKKGGRYLTKEQKAKVMDLSSKEIEAKKTMDKLEERAREFFTKDSLKAFNDAQIAHAKAKIAFDEYSYAVAPRDLPDMLVKMIQGNLLTPLSIAANVYGNMFWAPLERTSVALSSAMDAVMSTGMTKFLRATGNTSPDSLALAGRSIMAGNPLPSKLEMAALADGVRTAAKELVTGPSEGSYVKAEIQRGFAPLRSLLDTFSGEHLARDADGKIAKWDRAKAFIEGTLGVPPEIMFRLLSIGDKPFRRAATVRAYIEQAKLHGVDEAGLEKFMAFPDQKVKEFVDKATKRSIFAEENAGITTLNRFLDKDMAKLLRIDKIPMLAGAAKVFGRLTVPFRQFPLNYALTALNFASPPLAMAKAVYYSNEVRKSLDLKKIGINPAYAAGKSLENRRKALTNLGEATLGFMMYATANILWEKGLISESSADTSAKRSDQAEAMGSSKLNKTGIERWSAGGDPSYRKGDTLVDWTRMGIPAVVFHIYTQQAAKERDKAGELGNLPEKQSRSLIEQQTHNLIGSLPGLGSFVFDQSFLSGTSALMDAIKDADPDSPKFKNWVNNMWKASTSIPIPNTLDAIARARMEYVPEMRGASQWETMANIWEHKVMGMPADMRDLVLKRDTWGRPVPRTPEGANPYVYGLMDVTKSGRQHADPHDQALYDLYRETNRASVYPDPVGRSISFNEKNYELDSKDVETLQSTIGQMRRERMEEMVDSSMWPILPPEDKVMALEQIYQGANTEGKEKFINSPEMYNKYFSDHPEKNTSTSITTKGMLMRKS